MNANAESMIENCGQRKEEFEREEIKPTMQESSTKQTKNFDL